MTLETLRDVFGWCSLMNLGILLFWAGFWIFAHDWVFRVHSKWFQLTPEQFESLHYGGIMGFKMAVFLFNIVPYFALRIVSG